MIDALTDLLARSERILVFTGAGVSVDSGIPDFRSPGGVWTRIDPMVLSVSTFRSGLAGRTRFWRALREVAESIGDPTPNPVHHAVARLEALGKVIGVVTQNVDGLHQAAGSSAEKVIELHGNLQSCLCLGCGRRWPAREVLARGDEAPACERCGGAIRPDVVVFEDPLPAAAVDRAWQLAREADLCLVLGSSLTVHPAADLPLVARRAGARLAIVTLGPTPIDLAAHLRLDAALGETFVPAVGRL